MSKKRLLSVVLVLAMCLGMLPTWAMADVSYEVYDSSSETSPFHVTITGGKVEATSDNESVTTTLKMYIVKDDPSGKLWALTENPQADTYVESVSGLGTKGEAWMELPKRNLTGFDRLQYLVVAEYVQQDDGTYKNGNFYMQRLSVNLAAKELKVLPIQQNSDNAEITPFYLGSTVKWEVVTTAKPTEIAALEPDATEAQVCTAAGAAGSTLANTATPYAKENVSKYLVAAEFVGGKLAAINEIEIERADLSADSVLIAKGIQQTTGSGVLTDAANVASPYSGIAREATAGAASIITLGTVTANAETFGVTNKGDTETPTYALWDGFTITAPADATGVKWKDVTTDYTASATQFDTAAEVADALTSGAKSAAFEAGQANDVEIWVDTAANGAVADTDRYIAVQFASPTVSEAVLIKAKFTGAANKLDDDLTVGMNGNVCTGVAGDEGIAQGDQAPYRYYVLKLTEENAAETLNTAFEQWSKVTNTAAAEAALTTANGGTDVAALFKAGVDAATAAVSLEAGEAVYVVAVKYALDAGDSYAPKTVLAKGYAKVGDALVSTSNLGTSITFNAGKVEFSAPLGELDGDEVGFYYVATEGLATKLAGIAQTMDEAAVIGQLGGSSAVTTLAAASNDISNVYLTQESAAAGSANTLVTVKYTSDKAVAYNSQAIIPVSGTMTATAAKAGTAGAQKVKLTTAPGTSYGDAAAKVYYQAFAYDDVLTDNLPTFAVGDTLTTTGYTETTTTLADAGIDNIESVVNGSKFVVFVTDHAGKVIATAVSDVTDDGTMKKIDGTTFYPAQGKIVDNNTMAYTSAYSSTKITNNSTEKALVNFYFVDSLAAQKAVATADSSAAKDTLTTAGTGLLAGATRLTYSAATKDNGLKDVNGKYVVAVQFATTDTNAAVEAIGYCPTVVNNTGALTGVAFDVKPDGSVMVDTADAGYDAEYTYNYYLSASPVERTLPTLADDASITTAEESGGALYSIVGTKKAVGTVNRLTTGQNGQYVIVVATSNDSKIKGVSQAEVSGVIRKDASVAADGTVSYIASDGYSAQYKVTEEDKNTLEEKIRVGGVTLGDLNELTSKKTFTSLKASDVNKWLIAVEAPSNDEAEEITFYGVAPLTAVTAVDTLGAPAFTGSGLTAISATNDGDLVYYLAKGNEDGTAITGTATAGAKRSAVTTSNYTEYTELSALNSALTAADNGKKLVVVEYTATEATEENETVVAVSTVGTVTGVTKLGELTFTQSSISTTKGTITPPTDLLKLSSGSTGNVGYYVVKAENANDNKIASSIVAATTKTALEAVEVTGTQTAEKLFLAANGANATVTTVSSTVANAAGGDTLYAIEFGVNDESIVAYKAVTLPAFSNTKPEQISDITSAEVTINNGTATAEITTLKTDNETKYQYYVIPAAQADTVTTEAAAWTTATTCADVEDVVVDGDNYPIYGHTSASAEDLVKDAALGDKLLVVGYVVDEGNSTWEPKVADSTGGAWTVESYKLIDITLNVPTGSEGSLPGALTVTIANGSAGQIGATTITGYKLYTGEASDTAKHYYYKLETSGDAIGSTNITQNDVQNSTTLDGWTELDGTSLAPSEIAAMNAAKGNKLHVIRLDAEMHVRQYGVATVTAENLALSKEAAITSVSFGTYTADAETATSTKLQWTEGAGSGNGQAIGTPIIKAVALPAAAEAVTIPVTGFATVSAGAKASYYTDASYSVAVASPISVTADGSTKTVVYVKVEAESGVEADTRYYKFEITEEGYTTADLTATGTLTYGSEEDVDVTITVNDNTFDNKAQYAANWANAANYADANVELAKVVKNSDTSVTLTLTPKDGGIQNKTASENADTVGKLTFTLPVSMFVTTVYANSTAEIAIPAAIYDVTTKVTVDGAESDDLSIATLSVDHETGVKNTEITITGTIVNQLYARDDTATTPAVKNAMNSGTKLSLTGNTDLVLALKSPKAISLAENGALVDLTIAGAFVDSVAKTAKVGSEVTVTLTPQNGAVINTVTATGVELAAPTSTQDGVYTYSVTVGDAPIVFTVTTIAAHTIDTTVTDGESTVDVANYTITGLGTEAQAGDAISFKVEAKNEWVLESVMLGEAELTPDKEGDYSFTMPGQNVEITVTLIAPTDMTLNFKDANGDELSEGVTATLTYWYGEATLEAATEAGTTKELQVTGAQSAKIEDIKAGTYSFQLTQEDAEDDVVLAADTFTLAVGVDGSKTINLAITPKTNVPVDEVTVEAGEAAIGTAEEPAEKDMEASITITSGALTSLADAEKVAIKLTNATVNLAGTVLAGVEATDPVTVSVETETMTAENQSAYATPAAALEPEAKAVVSNIGKTLMIAKSIDINVNAGGTPVSIGNADDPNAEAIGSVTVKATAPETAVPGAKAQVYFVKSEGGQITKMEKVETTTNGDGTVTFSPKHFSEYVIVYEVMAETGDPYILSVTDTTGDATGYKTYNVTVNGAVTGDDYLVFARTVGNSYVFNPIKLTTLMNKSTEVYVADGYQVDLFIVEKANLAEADEMASSSWTGISLEGAGARLK